MGQAEIQNAIKDGKWYTVSEIIKSTNKINRPPVLRALSKMIQYNEVEKKSFIKEWRLDSFGKKQTRIVPHYRLLKDYFKR